jgi:hypothetical protein
MLVVVTPFMSQQKREVECVCCSLLKNFKGPLKINGRVEICLNRGVTCPSQAFG